MTRFTKDAVVRARIDPKLKEQAALVLQALGITKLETLTPRQFWARKRALQVADHAKAATGTLQPEETLLIPARMLHGAVPDWPQDAFAECEVTFE